ncbi:MAG: hypothetical protein ACFB4I_17520 [Cyanophyceae cyanobacterium]
MAQKVWEAQRNLEYVQARNNYYSNLQRPRKSTVTRQPKDTYLYRSMLLRQNGSVPTYAVQVSRPAKEFFAGTGDPGALGLSALSNEDFYPGPPRNFKTSKIKAIVGDATPTVSNAFDDPNGRRIIKYYGNTAGDAQAHYQAPICARSGNNGPQDVINQFREVARAKAGAVIPPYGKIHLQFEQYTLSGT